MPLKPRRYTALIPALLIAGLVHAAILGWLFSTDKPINTEVSGVQVELKGTHPHPLPAVADDTPVDEAQTQPITDNNSLDRASAEDSGSHQTPPKPVQQTTTVTPAPVQPRPEPANPSVEHTPAKVAAPASPAMALNAPADKPPEPVKSPANAKVEYPLSPAQSISGRTPTYPPLAIRRHQQGQVRVHLWLSANGRVSRFELTQSSGHRLLDQAVIDFIETEDFRLPEQHGDLTEQVFEFTFRLN